jgi:hypothetical protein
LLVDVDGPTFLVVGKNYVKKGGGPECPDATADQPVQVPHRLKSAVTVPKISKRYVNFPRVSLKQVSAPSSIRDLFGALQGDIAISLHHSLEDLI